MLPAIGRRTLDLAAPAPEPGRAQHHGGVQKVAVHAPDPAAPAAGVERQDGAERAHRAGGEVGRGQLGGEGGRIAAAALGAREAHQRLRQRVDAGALRIGAGQPVAGDMRLDQLRIDIRADAHARRGAGAQIGEQHIAHRRHAPDRLRAARLAGVDAERALVEVQIVEIVAPDRPREVAARRLQLDDLRAQIGEQPPAGRPGDQIGDLQHAHPGERQRLLRRRFGRGRRVERGELRLRPDRRRARALRQRPGPRRSGWARPSAPPRRAPGPSASPPWRCGGSGGPPAPPARRAPARRECRPPRNRPSTGRRGGSASPARSRRGAPARPPARGRSAVRPPRRKCPSAPPRGQ